MLEKEIMYQDTFFAGLFNSFFLTTLFPANNENITAIAAIVILSTTVGMGLVNIIRVLITAMVERNKDTRKIEAYITKADIEQLKDLSEMDARKIIDSLSEIRERIDSNKSRIEHIFRLIEDSKKTE